MGAIAPPYGLKIFFSQYLYCSLLKKKKFSVIIFHAQADLSNM